MSATMKPEINVKVKVGLLTTVAKQVYSSTSMKIREAVSNSMDNSATKFILSLIKNSDHTYSLSMFDNGHGMTQERIKEIFQSLGYGLYRDEKNNKKYYSYFGLGLMSIFQLGEEINIITRPEKSGEVNKIFINSAKVFSKELEKEHIESLKEYISLYPDSSIDERHQLSHLHKEEIDKICGSFPECFTEIIISKVKAEDIEFLKSAYFTDDIRKMLPLDFEEDHPFLKNLEESDKKTIIDILQNLTYCPTIDFYCLIDGPKSMRQLKKYFPDFPHSFKKGNYQIHISDQSSSNKKNGFTYYFLTATKDLGVKADKERETGIWIRNKNILVKAADYLQYQGSGSFMREPLKNWLFGEVFHSDMNSFLEVSRKDFITSSEEFKSFRNKIEAIIKPISERMYESYRIGMEVVGVFTGPFEDIDNKEKSPFHMLEKRIFKLEGQEIIGSKAKEVFTTLGNISNLELEQAPEVISKIGKEPIVISSGDDHYVTIDPNVAETEISYNIEKERVEEKISPSILQCKLINFFGKQYTVYFIDGREIEAGISINNAQRKIYINIFQTDLKNYSVSFIDILVTIEYAYQKTKTRKDMKDMIYALLGTDFRSPVEYVDNLSEYL